MPWTELHPDEIVDVGDVVTYFDADPGQITSPLVMHDDGFVVDGLAHNNQAYIIGRIKARKALITEEIRFFRWKEGPRKLPGNAHYSKPLPLP